MSRRRYISTAISLDKSVNALTQSGGDFAALLYTWMIPHAEDSARITGDPEELLYTVVPGRRDKTAEDVAGALECMASLRLIAWDRTKAIIYFDTESFYRYQAYIPVAKRADNRRHFAKNGEKRQSSPEVAQKAASLSLSPSPSLTERKSVLSDSGESAGAIRAAFDEFWTAFGRVGSKADALELYRWWRAKGEAGADELLAAATSYRSHCSATDCKMQHARTFLAKKPNRWREWADGDSHGGMDARRDSVLNDVLAAGADAFGLLEGSHGRSRYSGNGKRPAGVVAGGEDAGRSIPEGELAAGE